MSEKKFGTFYGIFVPNVTMMFGVIIFLRLGVVTGNAGLVQTLLVVGFSLLIMLITSTSIAMVATNMDVGSGGVYYLITRYLGIEIGGSLGFSIYLAQILIIALTISAFSYTLVEIFPFLNLIIIEILSLLLLSFLSSCSAKIALHAQAVILVVLLIAVTSVFFGSSEGLILPANPKPFFEGGKLSFWQAFSILYPALTGIEAGMALSGNLKNPARSLLFGNILSLLFVATIYSSIIIYSYIYIPKELLLSDPFVFMDYAYPRGLVIIGVCAATLSSALSSLLGSPRILQSMAEDNLVSKIFAKKYGAYGEPRWALVLTSMISMGIMLMMNIDQILPIYAMICLISYGFLNITAAVVNSINAPSWRPTFRVPSFLPVIGTLMCLVSMFMIEAGWSFIAISIVTLFYLILKRKIIKASFQDIWGSILFALARHILYLLDDSDADALTWHPQIMVLSITPAQYPKMLHLAKSMTENNGLLTFAIVLPKAWESLDRLHANKEALKSYFLEQKIKCMIAIQTASNTYKGFINLIKGHGTGMLQPNTILVPVNTVSDINENFLELVKQCNTLKKNLLIYKGAEHKKEKTHDFQLKSKEKSIDIWWSSIDKESNALLISYIHALQCSLEWRHAKVYLNVFTKTSQEEESLSIFLKKFIKKSRLKMTLRTVIRNSPTDVFFNIETSSEERDLTFHVLSSYTNFTTENAYKNYVKNVIRDSQKLKNDCILVTSYDQITHCKIYTYPDHLIESQKTMNVA